MPQFDFWASWDDSQRLLNRIAETDEVDFIRDVYYAEPQYERIADFDNDEMDRLRARPCVYLSKRKARPHKCCFREVESHDGNAKYAIDISYTAL